MVAARQHRSRRTAAEDWVECFNGCLRDEPLNVKEYSTWDQHWALTTESIRVARATKSLAVGAGIRATADSAARARQ